MKGNVFKIEISYSKYNDDDRFPMVIITDNKTFGYTCIDNLYETGPGHGIQVDDTENEEILLEMCSKISDIIFKTRDNLCKCNNK